MSLFSMYLQAKRDAIPGRAAICMVFFFLATTPPCSFAQTISAPVKAPVYDAVSIKLNKSGHDGWDTDSNMYRYSAKNISLKNLLEEAYGIRKELVSGVDGPVASARFDIEAKIVDPDPVAIKNLTQVQLRSMILGILLDRFKLVAHTESKTLPVYRLELAKDGPKFKESTTAEDAKDRGTHIQNREMTANGISMASLADTLTNQVQRTVIDETGLTAEYDMTMKWSADGGSNTQPDAPPLIFTALKEQLGLKLEPAKGPVETLVVDHIEMPSEN